MDIALDLARSRQGLTGTNPSVGCEIVKNNNIFQLVKLHIMEDHMQNLMQLKIVMKNLVVQKCMLHWNHATTKA